MKKHFIKKLEELRNQVFTLLELIDHILLNNLDPRKELNSKYNILKLIVVSESISKITYSRCNGWEK